LYILNAVVKYAYCRDNVQNVKMLLARSQSEKDIHATVECLKKPLYETGFSGLCHERAFKSISLKQLILFSQANRNVFSALAALPFAVEYSIRGETRATHNFTRLAHF
jgi:hypothetical protein